jgi:hypothetical protein
MPVFHTTESVFARDILCDRELRPATCKVYQESLLYFFYGKPSFRAGADTQATSMLEYYPFVFVFSANAVEQARRLMPFDSGALAHGMYKEFIHPKLGPANFEIPPPVENLTDVVHHFFGTNLNYFFGRTANVPTPRSTQFELSSLARMIHASGVSSTDNRRISCEIQVDRAVALDRNGTLGVIAPSVFADEPYFIQSCAELELDVELYDIHLGVPREVYGEVFARAQNLLRKWDAI